MNQIECIKSNGGTIVVPSEKLILRPAVYGIIPWNKTLLLLKSQNTDPYHLPGGDVRLGERIENALQRELREELGLEIEIRRFLGFREHFFFVECTNQAYQEIQFYYFCQPRHMDPMKIGKSFWGGLLQVRWVDIASLTKQDFLNNGNFILESLNSITALETCSY